MAAKVKLQEPLVNEFAAAHGDYQPGVVVDLTGELGGRRQSMVRVVRNRHTFIVDKWIAEHESGFEEQAVRAIVWVQGLWGKAGTVRSTTAMWGHVPGAGTDDGGSQQYALTELANLRRKFPPHHWNAFENSCRWNECPEEGTPAYEFHKHATGFIACTIATWNGF